MTPPLLTASFGAGTGDHLSLRARDWGRRGELDRAALMDTVKAFGCPAGISWKAADLLARSGRYDCFVQAGWTRVQRREVEAAMAELGVDVVWTRLLDRFDGSYVEQA